MLAAVFKGFIIFILSVLVLSFSLVLYLSFTVQGSFFVKEKGSAEVEVKSEG